MVINWKTLTYTKEITPLYEVSSCGKIRNKTTGKLLKTYIDKDGYEHVTLSTPIKGVKKSRHYPVHRLVAYNFVKGFKDGLTVNHKDDNKTNNTYSNLEWMTLSENVKTAYKTGANVASTSRVFARHGTDNGRCSVVEDDIHDICNRILKGEKNNAILKALPHIPISTIERTRNKKTWSEISDNYFSISKVEGKRDLQINPV